MALLWLTAFVLVYELFKRGVYLGVKMALREESDRLADEPVETPERQATGLREGAKLRRQPERR